MRKIFSKPLLITAICIFSFIGVHALLTVGRMYGSDPIVRLCGMLQGMGTTPFFMETGVVIFGFLCVLTINHFRQKWDGDELVYLEVVEDPTDDLPSDSKAVIFDEMHEKEDQLKISIAAIEGAIASNDIDQAKQLIAELSSEELQSSEVSEVISKLPS